MHGNLHKSDDEDCVSRLDHNILAPSYENYNNSIIFKNDNSKDGTMRFLEKKRD